MTGFRLWRRRAVLDIGQERVLLRFVETADFIDEQQRAAAHAAAVQSAFEYLAEIRNAGEDGRNRLELQIGVLGQQAGKRRFAAAGRAPEDER